MVWIPVSWAVASFYEWRGNEAPRDPRYGTAHRPVTPVLFSRFQTRKKPIQGRQRNASHLRRPCHHQVDGGGLFRERSFQSPTVRLRQCWGQKTTSPTAATPNQVMPGFIQAHLPAESIGSPGLRHERRRVASAPLARTDKPSKAPSKF